MRPIKTQYDGNWYESLLEARWAVFFDNAGIPYEYEYTGYKLGEWGETWYLPDFWLPEQRVWVEIKPHSDFVGVDIKKITHFEQALRHEQVEEFEENADYVRREFYVFVGSPYFNGKVHTYKIFRVRPASDSLELYHVTHNLPAASVADLQLSEMSSYWIHCPLCERFSLGTGFGQVRGITGIAREERALCTYCFVSEPRHGEVQLDEKDNQLIWCDELSGVNTTRLGYILGSPRLTKGYKAAREFKAPRKGSS